MRTSAVVDSRLKIIQNVLFLNLEFVRICATCLNAEIALMGTSAAVDSRLKIEYD